MAKSTRTRLDECIATIRAEGGAIDVEHIESMATDRISTISANISLSHDLPRGERRWPGARERKLVRAILLVEGCRASNATVSRQRKIDLCAMDEAQLRAVLRALLGPTREDPDGPLYIAQGNGRGIPKAVPPNWDQHDSEGGRFHYACHLDRQVICLGRRTRAARLAGIVSRHIPRQSTASAPTN